MYRLHEQLLAVAETVLDSVQAGRLLLLTDAEELVGASAAAGQPCGSGHQQPTEPTTTTCQYCGNTQTFMRFKETYKR